MLRTSPAAVLRAVIRNISTAAGLVIASAGIAAAQTTVTLHEPNTRAWSATVRGGTFASKNLKTILETRSSTDPEYARRALLKFDTQNTIPAGKSITSAILTVTVKDGSGDSSRRIGAYQVKTSWDENEVTWKVRRTATSWADRWRRSGHQAHREGRRQRGRHEGVVRRHAAGAAGGLRRPGLLAIYAHRPRRPRQLDERVLACVPHLVRRQFVEPGRR